MKNKKLNVFWYVGGKSYMINEIVSRLDYSCETYIELFGGALSVLLNKPPHQIEIANDINDDIVNFFKVVKDKKGIEAFKKELKYILYAETTFKKYLNSNPQDKISKAVRWFVIQNMSFAGNGSSFGYSFTRRNSKKFFNKLAKIDLIYQRLQNVQILKKDFRVILDTIKNKKGFMLYCDPPYINAEHYYQGNFTIKDHQDLAEMLNFIADKHKILISYYDDELLNKLYPSDKWKKEVFIKTKYSYGLTKNSKKLTKPKGKEVLISNYFMQDVQLFKRL